MATQRQLKVCLFGFPYGGNSGVSSEQSTVGRWREQIAVHVQSDSRIRDYYSVDLNDTPITMTRNRAVVLAREAEADVLVMVDSDMSPDVHCQKDQHFQPTAKPFFQTAFDYLYEHYDRGPVCLMAPYGGKSDHENMFVFRWRAANNDAREDNLPSLEQWTREECWAAAGIHDVAAGPTGLIMVDMRCFKLTEPRTRDDNPWFYYEWTDRFCQQKASTEDVTFTRNLSIEGQIAWGYNPCKVLFDCWAGHNGFRVTRKPRLMTDREVALKFYNATQRRATDQGVMDAGNMVAPVPTPKVDKPTRMALARFREQIAASMKASDLTPLQALKEFMGRNHTDADMAVLRELCQQAKRTAKVLDAIEVGSLLGESAKEIVASVNGDCALFCVDTWKGTEGDMTGVMATLMPNDGLYKAFRENVGSELLDSGCVSTFRMSSPDAARSFVDGKCDLIFIDANHEYAAVKADIEAWLPKVRDGGILCGHDYGAMEQADGRELFPGVRQAVDEKFGDQAVRHAGTSMWSIRVKHNPSVVTSSHEGNGRARELVGAGAATDVTANQLENDLDDDD